MILGVWNLVFAYTSHPALIASINAFCGGWCFCHVVNMLINADINRAKDNLIDVLERNQKKFIRFLQSLEQAGKYGPFEVTVEKIEKDKPEGTVH